MDIMDTLIALIWGLGFAVFVVMIVFCAVLIWMVL